MIAFSLRLLAAHRAGAVLVARPHSPVVHVYRGPLTESGRYVPTSARTVCSAHTRRLSVVDAGPSLRAGLGGRRVCRRCQPLLPACLGRVSAAVLPTRDDWMAAFGHLTAADVITAARWAWSVDETHQVGRVAEMLLGSKLPVPRSKLTSEAARRAWDAHAAVLERREVLRRQELSADDLAEAAAIREAADDLSARAAAQRREDARTDRLNDLRLRGGYLAPWERDVS